MVYYHRFLSILFILCITVIGQLHAGYNPKIITLSVKIDSVLATANTGHCEGCKSWSPGKRADYVTWVATKLALTKTHTITSQNPTGLSATSKFSISDGFSLTNDGSITGPNTVTNDTGRMTALTKTGEYKLVATVTCENRSATDAVIIAVIKLDKLIAKGVGGGFPPNDNNLRGNEITDSTDEDATPNPKQVFCIEKDGEKEAYVEHKVVLDPEPWTYAGPNGVPVLLWYIKWTITDDDNGCWFPMNGDMSPNIFYGNTSQWKVKADYFLDDRKATLTAWYDRCGDGTLSSSDAPAWKRTVEIIAVGAIISGPPMDWEPKGGDEDNEVPVAIAAIPSEAKGTFTADLYDHSNEPGYCLNMPVDLPTTGEDSVTWKDLRIDDGGDWVVSGDQDQSGVYFGPEVNFVNVPVISTDYGSWGKIKGYYYYSSGIKVRAWDVNLLTRNYANIPLDENGNHVPDIAEQDSYASVDLEENHIFGYVIRGDGFTGYEEWRGFIVQGSHIRTNAGEKRDLFIYDEDSLGFGYYPTASGIVCHSIKDTEWTGTGSSNSPPGTKPKRLMSINRGTTSALVDQFGLHLKKGKSPKYPNAWGVAEPEAGAENSYNLSPKKTICVWVAKVEIKDILVNIYYKPMIYADDYVDRSITHEIGHATGVLHHVPKCGGEPNCVMTEYPKDPCADHANHPLPIIVPSSFCTTVDRCKDKIDVK